MIHSLQVVSDGHISRKLSDAKMKKRTEEIIRYLLIIGLMGLAIYSMIKLIQKQAAIVEDSPKSEKSFVLKKDTVYGIEIGTAKEEIYGLFTDDKIEPITLFLEGKPTSAMEISIDLSSALIAELVDDKVYRIRVLDYRFKTQKGIHIGSTLKELEQAYKNIIYGSSDDSIFATVRPIQMSFVLDSADEVPLEWYKSHDRNLLNDNAKIIKILVF